MMAVSDDGCSVWLAAGTSLFMLLIMGSAFLTWDARARRDALLRALSQYPGVQVSTGMRLAATQIYVPGPPSRAMLRYAAYPVGSPKWRDVTEFTAVVDRPRAMLRLVSSAWGLEWGGFGAPAVRTGDASFDATFAMLGFPAAAAVAFLDASTRELIGRIRDRGFGGLLLEVRPELFVLRLTGWIQQPDFVAQLFADACALVQRIEGIELGAVVLPHEAACKVCGTAIEADKRVLCRKCRTPHHADCWAYNDGCSTFACGERRSVRG